MTIKVAINGYGRIGRNVLKALYESGKRSEIQIVAINDLGDEKLNTHLTRYDTVYGRFNFPVSNDDSGAMSVDGDAIRMFSERDPASLPWGGVECGCGL